MISTEEKIKELEETIIWMEERYYDKDINPPTHRLERHIQLLKTGVTVEEVSSGFLVNNKFVIAANKNRWRIKGKAVWYYFKNIDDFIKRYVK